LSLRDQDSQGWITDKRSVLEATCLGLCCSNILS
jgi:hypothetical protein